MASYRRLVGGAMMDEKTLAEIEARASAATTGPWDLISCRTCDEVELDGAAAACQTARRATDADYNLINHARDDLPALVAEVRRLMASNARLTAAMVSVANMELTPGRWCWCASCHCYAHPDAPDETCADANAALKEAADG